MVGEHKEPKPLWLHIAFFVIPIGVLGSTACESVCPDARVRQTVTALWEDKPDPAVSESVRVIFEKERVRISPAFKLWGQDPENRSAHRIWYDNNATYAIEMTCPRIGKPEVVAFRTVTFSHP